MQLMPISFLFLTNLVIHVDSNWQSLLHGRTVIMYNGKPCEKNLQSADWCHLVSGPRTVKKCGELSRTYKVPIKRSCISQETSNVSGTLGTYEVLIILSHLFNLCHTYVQYNIRNRNYCHQRHSRHTLRSGPTYVTSALSA